jgi:citrate lyase beta subunit
MPVLTSDSTAAILARLAEANRQFAAAHPGDKPDRQPVHTVYGGAHLFAADSAPKLGAAALRALEEWAPDAETFARALGIPDMPLPPLPGAAPKPPQRLLGVHPRLSVPGSGAKPAPPKSRESASPAGPPASHATLAEAVYARVVEKLQHEPVEDFRIDFEDGYGNRSDAEEDEHAVAAATEMAKGLEAQTLPPFMGIRIKPLTDELHARSLRTLDLFVTTLLARSGGVMPPHFVVTLPKITVPEQVSALVESFEVIERGAKLFPNTLRLELMIETPQSIASPRGGFAIPQLIAAARGRCRGLHFGTYDYTAGVNITAMHQVPSHPACDFARHVMQVCSAGTGVTLSDGATTVMPVAPHRPGPDGAKLRDEQIEENRRAVHRAWKIHYDDVRSSLRHAYYQGWDLHPAQLPTRYAAVYAFFLEARGEAAARLKLFIEKAAQATLLGNVFDDAATGQGLLNFFLRGINCGAFAEEDALTTGLAYEELQTRSFVKILARRRGS